MKARTNPVCGETSGEARSKMSKAPKIAAQAPAVVRVPWRWERASIFLLCHNLPSRWHVRGEGVGCMGPLLAPDQPPYPRAMARSTLFALCLLSLSAPPSRADAEPTVSVKARVRVDGLRAETNGRRVHVLGALVDNLGHAVPGHEVTLTIDKGPSVRVRTDGDGHFRRRFRVDGLGQHVAVVEFGGSPLLAGAQSRVRFVAGRRPVTLTLVSSPEVPAGPPVSLVLQATVDTKPARRARLRVETEAGPSPIRETRADGRVSVTLPPMSPGMHAVTVAVMADDLYSGGELRIDIESVQPTPAVLRLSSQSPIPPAAPVTFQVQFGAPELDAPPSRVTLTLDGHPHATQARVEGGLAQFIVPRGGIDPGRHTARATVTPLVPGWRDAITPPITVDVPPPPPPSAAWQSVPLALSLLALLALGIRWRPGPRAAATPATQPKTPPAFEFTGASETRGTLRLTIVDGGTGQPMAASVVLGGAQTCAWSLEPPPGEPHAVAPRAPLSLPVETPWVWCVAPGYMPAVHRLPGRAGRASIALLPPRAHVQRRFGRVLEQAGLPPLEFGRESPREAGRALIERGGDSGDVDVLVEGVERACFGAHAPSEEAVVQVEWTCSRLDSTAWARHR